jgi:RecJ-like exonuclease
MIFINCQSCKKQTNPEMDKKTEKIYCSKCEAEQPSNHFLKMQMHSAKMYRQRAELQDTFSVVCNACKERGRPEIKGSKVYCKSCSKEITHLSDIFINALKDYLKNAIKNSDAM